MGQLDLQSDELRGVQCHRLSKVEYHFFTLLQRVKSYLLLRYCIMNQSIGTTQGALLNLFQIFECITDRLFAGLLRANCPDIEIDLGPPGLQGVGCMFVCVGATYMHVHPCVMLQIHIKKLQMANFMGIMFSMFNKCVCVHMCMCVCACAYMHG